MRMVGDSSQGGSVRTILSKAIVAFVLLGATAIPAAAQQRPATAQPSGNSGGTNVGAGFMLLRWIDAESTAKGLAADVTKTVSGNISVGGDLTWGKDGDETDFAVGGLVRYTTAAGGRARVFGQVQVGLIRWSIADCCDDSA